MFTGGFLATFFSHRMEEDFKQDSGGADADFAVTVTHTHVISMAIGSEVR